MSNGDDEISRRELCKDNESREDLRTIYKATQDARLNFRGRIWDTIRTSATLVAGLLVAAAAVVFRRGEADAVSLLVIGLALLVVGVVIGGWNYLNAKEEQEHQLKLEFTLYQIEHLLGLHRVINKDDRWPGPTSIYRHMFEPKNLGDDDVAKIFAERPDAPVAYAKARWEGRGARGRLLFVSILLGLLPTGFGAFLIISALALLVQPMNTPMNVPTPAAIDAVTVFALFYAIMFGATLNRLADWSAFGPIRADEQVRQWCTRVALSVICMHALPALYFAVLVWLLVGSKPPAHLGSLISWILMLFFAVLFIPACYRLWAGVVQLGKLHPPSREEDTQHRPVAPSTYFWQAAAWTAFSWLAATGLVTTVTR